MNAIAFPSPVRRAPIDLWRIAEAFIQTLHMLFGEPKDVARGGVLSTLAHRQLASWLRCAEAMLRRLLLIEAAALPTPNAPSQSFLGVRTKRVRTRTLHEFWPDQPEDWRVSFRCLLGPPASRRRVLEHGASTPARRRRSKQQFRDAWPLAERYEALLRVFENPEPTARRLARRLRANPLRACVLLCAPPEADERIDRFDELTSAATRDRDRLCDSS